MVLKGVTLFVPPLIDIKLGVNHHPVKKERTHSGNIFTLVGERCARGDEKEVEERRDWVLKIAAHVFF